MRKTIESMVENALIRKEPVFDPRSNICDTKRQYRNAWRSYAEKIQDVFIDDPATYRSIIYDIYAAIDEQTAKLDLPDVST